MIHGMRILRKSRLLFFVQMAGLGMQACSAFAEDGGWAFHNGQWNAGAVELPRKPADAFLLTNDNGAPLPIVVADAAPPPEQTAARELSHYLEKISGRPFPVVSASERTVDSPAIFIGRSLAPPDAPHDLGAEEWRKEIRGSSLYLYGGFPRGTLYAVYHLLEDEMGVHWWTPTAETAPHAESPTVSRALRSGQPAFSYRRLAHYYAAERESRDEFQDGKLVREVGFDGGRFAARNRMNSQKNADYKIRFEYGGDWTFGLPNHCHTYSWYVNPKEYFEKHPEWFSLINGRRTHHGGQLDVLNPELRKFFLERLKENIRTTLQEDAREGYRSRIYFDISPNDNEGYDEGPASLELVEREGGTQMAPLLDLVNFLSKGIREEFPGIRLETLAYKATREPPLTLRAEDNVTVTVADTESNPARAHEPHGEFLSLLGRWKDRAASLRVWDYANAYGPQEPCLPLPIGSALYSDLGQYKRMGVEGVIIELGEPWMGADRDWLYWILLKGLEDPSQDFQKLERAFAEGYWGPAASFILSYHESLRKVAAASAMDHLRTFQGHLPTYDFLTPTFLREADALFDSAEKAVQRVTDSAEALHRVRRARMGVDSALLRFDKGGPDLDTVAERLRNTLRRNVDDAVLPEIRRKWYEHIDDKLLILTSPTPDRSGLPTAANGKVFDFLPAEMGWNAGRAPIQNPEKDRKTGSLILARPVQDPLADSGVAIEVSLQGGPGQEADKIFDSLLWKYFGLTETRLDGGAMPKVSDGEDYRWYPVGSFSPVARGLAGLFAPEQSILGVLWVNTDYYPELDKIGPVEFMAKMRRTGPTSARVSRICFIQKENKP